MLNSKLKTKNSRLSPLTILALGPIPPPYHGVATFLRELLDATDLDGIMLQHLDTSDRRDTSNLGRWDAENLSIGFSNLAELAERCMRTDAQIIYLPLSQSVAAFLRDALFILQSHQMGKRVVIHLHGGYFRTLYEQQGAVFQAIARAALSCVSAAIVLGEGFRGIFKGLIPDERIFVVENGVADLFPERAAPPSPSARETLLYMSTLTRTKGILELIRATSILRASRPLIRLRIAGAFQEPELESEAHARVRELQLADAVTFVGNVTGLAKAQFLSSGDIFCLPTRYPFEGQPLVLLEAMSAGLPVVTTDRGVIPSTVADGVTGRVLPQDAPPEKLAEVLADLLTDRVRLSAMGAQGRQRFLERYTLHMCHQNLARVFRDVTDEYS
jgi:glycosyltransferase involved in cell wall biosynthesis